MSIYRCILVSIFRNKVCRVNERGRKDVIKTSFKYFILVVFMGAPPLFIVGYTERALIVLISVDY